MNGRTFDPTADAGGNYLEAMAALRLRALITGERWASEHDTFDLVLAAALMQGRKE
jgi:hypothetical protein